jgi:hypothetical protein
MLPMLRLSLVADKKAIEHRTVGAMKADKGYRGTRNRPLLVPFWPLQMLVTENKFRHTPLRNVELIFRMTLLSSLLESTNVFGL